MSGNTAVCNDTTEAVEFFKQQGLYLKPIAKLNVSVQLPQLKQPGKTISNWEVMEKVKQMVKPHSFLAIKVIKSTLEFIRLEGEAENKVLIKTMIQRLEGKTIKLSGFPDTLKVKAAEAKINFPSRHTWDSYFRDAKNMNEMKPGERPDTLHLKELPTKWFSTRRSRELDEPSEQVLRRIFEGFGEVRCVDIPMLDPYRKEMTHGKKSIQTFTFGQGLTFEAFVQYKEYIGFVKAMDALRGMKLLYIPEEEEGKAYAATIKVDFDRTKHLSDRAIKKRRIEREKLMQLEQEREEKVRKEREEEARKQEEERRRKEEEEQEKERKRLDKIQKREERRKEREEKRRQKKEERKKREEERQYQLKIAMEERRFLVAQRKLESIRLLTELFNRVKVIKVQEDLVLREKELELEKEKQIEMEKKRKEEEKQRKKEEKQQKKEQLQRQEYELRHKILLNFKKREEQKEEELREQLREKLAGTNKMKSAVVMKKRLKEVINQEGQSVDLYGYGTMSSWDQSLMDENYRQWAMAFYRYWYQRYAALGFYKPKAMGFYKPKGFGTYNRGNEGFFKFSPNKHYKQGGKGFHKPGMKGYYNKGAKRFFKHQSQGFFQARNKEFSKQWKKNYYKHDSRQYDSEDYEYKPRDSKYEHGDYSDDSDYYYDGKTKRQKQRCRNSESESDTEVLKPKRQKDKQKTSKKIAKRRSLKDSESSDFESGEIESVKSDDSYRKRKIVEKSDNLKVKKRKKNTNDEKMQSVKIKKEKKVDKQKKKKANKGYSRDLKEESVKKHGHNEDVDKEKVESSYNQETNESDSRKLKEEKIKSEIDSVKSGHIKAKPKRTIKRHRLDKTGLTSLKKKRKTRTTDNSVTNDASNDISHTDDVSKNTADETSNKNEVSVKDSGADTSGKDNFDDVSFKGDIDISFNDQEVGISNVDSNNDETTVENV